jgi:hypothetical protein
MFLAKQAFFDKYFFLNFETGKRSRIGIVSRGIDLLCVSAADGNILKFSIHNTIVQAKMTGGRPTVIKR